MNELDEKVSNLHGPILVLGASGFLGANLFRTLLRARNDVFGTASRFPAWRLEGLDEDRLLAADLLVESNLEQLLEQVRPRTVLNCAAYGAYPFETDTSLIYRTNLNITVSLLEALAARGIHRYIHAGTSSEYGGSAAAPTEVSPTDPNSHYAASKVSAAAVLSYLGKHRGFPGANLRLYSVYGPYEDASRLIPTLLAKGLGGELPPFVHPDISRDFLFVEDACEAFVDAALNLRREEFGDSFNIGTGRRTTIREIADLSRKTFRLEAEPEFTMQERDWDVTDWYADPRKANDRLRWQARTSLEEGFQKTLVWYKQLENPSAYLRSSKKFGLDYKHSISAVVACYKDAEAIPIMYERLTKTFESLVIDYEIIFVNDCSPDDSEEVIRRISSRDRRVTGISHSRNFGSQAAFRSGMDIATKNACVILDGDLQDPPELIREFVARWREGYDVVYGRRVKREAPWYMQVAYKLFYRVFDRFSYLRIPHDAGDFSLMDKCVVRALLQFPERDLFLRGVRAFVGFRQAGVDYVRPERMFGTSTNSLLRNVGWAKKGILSFSNTPLNMMTAAAGALGVVFVVLATLQIVAKLWLPDLAPRGITTLILIIAFFGTLNVVAISVLGEYIAKIFEEVKQRPHYLRRALIRDGEVRDAAEELRVVNR